MSTVRVWNVTDDPTNDVTPHNRMVLGKTLKPGRSVKVDTERLAKAHKVNREVEAGYLHIGDQPPAAYTAAKSKKRAKPDARQVQNGRMVGSAPGVSRAHGPVAVAPSEEIKVEDKVEVKDEVKSEVKKEVKDAPKKTESKDEKVEPPKEEETSKGAKKKKG